MMQAAKNKLPHDAARAAEVSAKLQAELQSVVPVAVLTGKTNVVPNDACDSAGWVIRFVPKPHLFRTGNDPVRMFRELAELGDLSVQCETALLPAFADLEHEECYLAWTLTLRGNAAEKAVREIFEWVDGDCDLTLMPLAPVNNNLESGVTHREITIATVAGPEVSSKAPDTRIAVTESRGEAASIRVNIDKVDALINMVGELVITQSMLSQIGKDFDMARIEKLMHGLAQLERNTRELQESVMSIRMMPMSFAFQRFPRMVRDLSQKLDKKIDLKLSGEQTELDKTVMEKIGDPLVHLVRNSVDHGIERPEVRRAAGKSETGAVHLSAFHQGGNIVIQITDDGAGLPKDKILKKARERGLVAPDATMTDEQIHDLIFQPGFSTADQVSDVSGRGVGMDVVRKNIRALGGSVEIRSEQGKGSVFTIRLPLTLAILDGQLINVGEQVYIVPLVSIVETLQMKKEQISAIAGRAELYRLRDEYIPVVRLYELLGVEPRQRELANGLLVVVEGEGQRVGLFVDDLQNQQQVVIKSLETNFKRVIGVSGATILGDGTVALILDITGIIQASRQSDKKSNTARMRAA